MECADAECIKIGTAKDVAKRLALLQCGNPLRITNAYSREFEGRRAAQVERAAHRHFKACRIRGEWFRVGAEEAEQFIAAQAESSSDQYSDHHFRAVAFWAGGQSALAQLLGVTKSAISQWGDSGIPANRAVQIERMTSGKFKAAVIARQDVA
jgi:DNA-binding transcriptional regulator YdaS (Cro superfamily)